MNLKSPWATLIPVLLTLTLTGCSSVSQANRSNLHTSSNSSSPPVNDNNSNNSQVSIAEVRLNPLNENPISASATLVVNKENQTLTVSVDAIHLQPNHAYKVCLFSNSASQLKLLKELNNLKSDEHGEATAMTIITHISSISPHGWYLRVLSDKNVIATGQIHLLSLDNKAKAMNTSK